MSKNGKILYDIVKSWNLPKGIYAIDGSINKTKLINISNCITARYDSGVQNRSSVGCMIIEIE